MAAWRAEGRRGRVSLARGAREERVGAKPGARRQFWLGCDAWGGQVSTPAANAVTARNREGGKGRKGHEGSFVNKLKFKMQLVNSVFLLRFGFK